MLNVSENKIGEKIKKESYGSFSMVKDYRAIKIFSRILISSLLVFLIVLFLPWTQTIRSKGYITTLKPDQRPQTINSIIAGKIEKWFVKEGDFVKKGDTILYISEVKDKYFDPGLLDNTESQINAKKQSVKSYSGKASSLDNQIDALLKTKDLKVQTAQNYYIQTQLKVKSDSINLQAAQTNYEIAKKQFERQEQLYKSGLKSLTDFEGKKMKLQQAEAKLISAQNKLLTSKNALINAKFNIDAIANQYRDKLSKAQSDKFSALSSMYDSEALVSKMQNQFMNYSIRKGMYYITAPQDGYITQAIRTGIGEVVKEGEKLVSIMPANYDIAVEMYIDPFDLPLIRLGEKVRFMFDGWPSIVFSGWPNASYGTFGGKIVAIDKFISPNGKYRILVAPDPGDVEWPKELRVGSGATGMAMLNDVPIWYELWRNLNGFPPDYYALEMKEKTSDKKKKK